MRVGSAAASHPPITGWPVLTSAGPAQKQRQLRAKRPSGASHWQEWREKEPDPSQTSPCSFIITKDVPAALKGFSKKTGCFLVSETSLAPTYCCNFSRTKLEDITWLQPLSPGYCHHMPPPKKAELAPYQCTHGGSERHSIWGSFPMEQSLGGRDLQRLQMDCHSSSLAPKATKSRLAQLVGHTPAGHSSLSHPEWQPREQLGTVQLGEIPKELPVIFFQPRR